MGPHVFSLTCLPAHGFACHSCLLSFLLSVLSLVPRVPSASDVTFLHWLLRDRLRCVLPSLCCSPGVSRLRLGAGKGRWLRSCNLLVTVREGRGRRVLPLGYHSRSQLPCQRCSICILYRKTSSCIIILRFLTQQHHRSSAYSFLTSCGPAGTLLIMCAALAVITLILYL